MSKSLQKTRRAQRQDRREERRREEERRRAAKKRLTIWISTIVGLVVVIIAVIILYKINPNILPTSAKQDTNTAITSDNPAYPRVDNIACQTNERLDYHIHALLSIYVDGNAVPLPKNIGVASDGSCIYWLHTHDNSGVIHVESPTTTKYSLGTFFKLWEDHFSSLGYPSKLDTTSGWQVYIDGKPYDGDFHNIQLEAHRRITLAYNSPNSPHDNPAFNWGSL
jgi:hypothetical protein